jgi:hypothetical protein
LLIAQDKFAVHQLHSCDSPPAIPQRLDKHAGAGGSGVLARGDVWLGRLIAVITNADLDSGRGAFVQGGNQLRTKRVAKPHVVHSQVESFPCRADERGQPRHHGIGGLFTLGEKENGEIIQERVKKVKRVTMLKRSQKGMRKTGKQEEANESGNKEGR